MSENDERVRSVWPRFIVAVRELPSSRWLTAALTTAGIAVIGVALLLLWRAPPLFNGGTPDEITVPEFKTRHGEQQTHRLADDSLLHLNLGSNQQLTVSEDAWPAKPVLVDAQSSTAWLHRQISFDHEPLERVAREFNRYSRRPIEITTPALRNLQISGIFSTDDTDAFIAFLRSLDGVQVEVTPTRIRVSQK